MCPLQLSELEEVLPDSVCQGRDGSMKILHNCHFVLFNMPSCLIIYIQMSFSPNRD